MQGEARAGVGRRRGRGRGRKKEAPGSSRGLLGASLPPPRASKGSVDPSVNRTPSPSKLLVSLARVRSRSALPAGSARLSGPSAAVISPEASATRRPGPARVGLRRLRYSSSSLADGSGREGLGGVRVVVRSCTAHLVKAVAGAACTVTRPLAPPSNPVGPVKNGFSAPPWRSRSTTDTRTANASPSCGRRTRTDTDTCTAQAWVARPRRANRKACPRRSSPDVSASPSAAAHARQS